MARSRLRAPDQPFLIQHSKNIAAANPVANPDPKRIHRPGDPRRHVPGPHGHEATDDGNGLSTGFGADPINDDGKGWRRRFLAVCGLRLWLTAAGDHETGDHEPGHHEPGAAWARRTATARTLIPGLPITISSRNIPTAKPGFPGVTRSTITFLFHSEVL